MYDLLVLAALLSAGLFLYWVVLAADAFDRLDWAERTSEYRLAAHCGYNPCFLPERRVPTTAQPLYRWARP